MIHPHNVGSVILAILLYIKNAKILPYQLLKKDMGKETGSVGESGTSSDNVSTGLKESGTGLGLLKLLTQQDCDE